MEYASRFSSPKKSEKYPRSPIDRMSPIKKSPLKNNPLIERDTAPLSPKKLKTRKDLPKNPFHQINSSNIPTNFYSNPIDWSFNDIIAYIANSKVHFFNSKSLQSIKIEVPLYDIQSLKFSPDGESLALGSDDGSVRLFDIESSKFTHVFEISSSGCSYIDRNETNFVSGFIDGKISLADLRSDEDDEILFGAESSPISLVKFIQGTNKVISSSESCEIKVWDIRYNSQPLLIFKEHVSAVRAIDYSPDRNLIASGGGSTDRNLIIWDINNGSLTTKKWIGSQICNLFWNSDYGEIVTTHGFGDCSISLWNAADVKQVGIIFANKNRVLYSAISNDRSKIITAAPGDPIMLWMLFPDSCKKITAKIR